MGQIVEEAKAMPRDLTHPYVHVEYWPQNWPHGHIVTACVMSDGEDFETYVDDVANELAEAVTACHPGGHVSNTGRLYGSNHSSVDSEKAYVSASTQLIARDYYQEYLDICRKIEHYNLWGGQPAELVFQPDFTSSDVNDWLMAIKHPETGMPHFYKINQKLLELPPPDPKMYRKGEYGWYGKDHNPAPRG